MLDELHVVHSGIKRMKSLARSYLWWPGVDADIEQKVKQCNQCQIKQTKLPVMLLDPWEWPGKPWSYIYLNHAKPFQGKMFLVIVDSHSKWLNMHVTSSTSSAITSDELQTTFATLVFPNMIFSNNGTCFRSQEFQTIVNKMEFNM